MSFSSSTALARAAAAVGEAAWVEAVEGGRGGLDEEDEEGRVGVQRRL